MVTPTQHKKDLENMVQIILLAIPREISAREFYLNAAAKYESERSRELFLALANEEKNHENALRRILGELQAELAGLSSSGN